MIFRKRFKNSWDNDTLTLPATRCMIPSSVAKKIFKSPHHARRRIKNQIPMIFVASVIKERGGVGNRPSGAVLVPKSLLFVVVTPPEPAETSF